MLALGWIESLGMMLSLGCTEALGRRDAKEAMTDCWPEVLGIAGCEGWTESDGIPALPLG
eukprot:CAMPEP_0119019252 /NCGR_PEP_ID=MMETSP1176-20130426/21351_1 /TAXON_ID=265551 /ORGANISM="Synedropsis recta cf, Strain CCMP1620" /LENGTH=59 /DNA_ID=CAMNT_0006973409 /DNA_START=632 /DNA_END=811 /DNA_ORIENTATION=+